MRIGVAVLGIGCTSGDGGGDSGPDTGTDTGLPACPVEVHLEAVACLESTGEVPVGTGYSGGDVGGAVDGAVSELGAPASLAGSAAVGGFSACDGAERIVRIVDDVGETWTVGWSVEGDVDALPDSLGVGSLVTLAFEWRLAGYSLSRNLVISDPGGPRFVFASSGLDSALIAPLEVNFAWRDDCPAIVEGVAWDETPITFTGVNTLTLFSGQAGSVALADRTLDVVVPASAWMSGCADGCGTYEWVGWD